MAPINVQSRSITEAVIIGAGPYGLSIAAHLAAKAVPFRIFGHPMSAWSQQMPAGMHLKSEGFASSLSDPAGEFTLRRYCEQQGIPYQDSGLPVKLETFVAYGLAFQRRYAPDLEQKLVASVRPSPAGFEVELEDGELVQARKVVVATGIGSYAHIPGELSDLPAEFLTHSSAHHSLEAFRGRRVAVVGAGASALDLLTLLHEAGAEVQLIARSSTIRFHDPPRPRPLRERLLRPMTGIGPGMQLFFYTHAPHLFRHLPEAIRLDRIHKVLGPAPGWFIKDRIAGRVPFHLSSSVASATVRNGAVRLDLISDSGATEVLEVDHVIAATGYRVDLERLAFLLPAMRERIRLTGQAPALSAYFESSVPGLYFVGVTAANSFGPLMRFACGSRFVAQHIVRRLAKPALQPAVAQPSKAEAFGRS